jgi:hypothetical protein
MNFIGHLALANHCYNCGVFTVDNFTHYTPVCILSEVNPFSITNTRVIAFQPRSQLLTITTLLLADLPQQSSWFNCEPASTYTRAGSSMTSGPPERVSWSGSHAGHRHACPWRNLFVCAHWSAPYEPSKLRSMHGLQTTPRHLLHQQSQVSDCRTTRSSESTLHRSAKNTHPLTM